MPLPPDVGASCMCSSRERDLQRTQSKRKMSSSEHRSSDGDGSLVQHVYAGAGVLVTGGTGFLGKVLIEKLLWACPDITAIYLLVRAKGGLTAQARLDALLNSQCFDRLRKCHGPGFGSKLIPVNGDVTKARLGLSDLDLDLLASHVTIVFHLAATVRFTEPLHVAVKQNVFATRELLELCRTFTGIKALVHVSTAFSHCPLSDIEERFYDAPMDCDVAIKMAAAGELTPAMTESLVGPWPNTYTFTKALAEDVVRKHGHGLPVCVYRPAIVIPSFKEPVAGWVDSMAGPASALAGFLTGFIRVLPGSPNIEAPFVPCDMVVDGLIVAAWNVAQKGLHNETSVYNYSTSSSNKLTWHYYFSEYRRRMREMPPSKAIWTASCLLTPSHTVLHACRFVFQTLPAGVFDAALFLSGRKPFASRLYRKVNTIVEIGEYFAKRHWRFQEENVPALWDRLDPRDKKVFNFDMRSLDWSEYIKNTSPGIREFVLKDDPSTIPAAKKRHNRILLVKKILWILLCLTIVCIIAFKFFSFLGKP